MDMGSFLDGSFSSLIFFSTVSDLLSSTSSELFISDTVFFLFKIPFDFLFLITSAVLMCLCVPLNS